MKQLLLALLLAFSSMGCVAAVAAALLSDGKADELVENFDETLEVQQQLAQFATATARGETDISQYSYDPPSNENNMTGTLTMNGANLPFGDGNVEIVFQVDGDNVPVDPYDADLSSVSELDGTVEIRFNGISNTGKDLDITADIDLSTIANNADDLTAILAGRWAIDLDDYQTTLTTDGVEMDVDLVTEEVTRLVGKIDGNVDIPDFPIDGNFDLEGFGEKIQVAIDVAITEIDYELDLDDLF